MLPEMPNFEEEVEAVVVEDNNDKQLVEKPQNGQKLAFKDYKLENIEAVVDSSKSFSQQVEDFVDVNATMAAAKDTSYSINGGKLLYVAIGALKEERAKTKELEERLAKLEKMLGV